MWRFVSSFLSGKDDEENEADDRLSQNVSSENNDLSEEVFEDCLDEDPEVFSSHGYSSQETAISSIYPSLSTIAVEHVPSPSSSFGKQALISLSSVQHSESSPHRNAISDCELNFRPADYLNYSEDDNSTHISVPQDVWDESSGSTSPVLIREFPISEHCNGSNRSLGHGSDSQIHWIPTAIPRGVSSDRRYSESGPWSCTCSGFPRRDVNGQRLSLPVVLNERGSPVNSFGNGVAQRPSPWSNVKCGVRAERFGAIHPLDGGWPSCSELHDDRSQDDSRLPTPRESISGTSGASFWEGTSPDHTCCSSTADILQSQISLGAFPLTNSPNCTVDRDSRQLSQLRFPQQRQGVNESSENTAFDPVSSFGNSSLDPQSEERRQRQSHGGRSVQWPQLTEHLSVLGKFDFSSKVFPVLTRLKGTCLKEYCTIEELYELDGVAEDEVNKYLWYLDGVHHRPTTKQAPKRDAGAASVFRCIVHRTGEVTFQIEEQKNQARTYLERVLGSDRVLKVFFEDGCDGKVTEAQHGAYHQLAKNGIFAGLRRYQYFAHKSSDKFEQKSEGKVKCYFVCTESRADADVQDSQFRQFYTITDVRCLFMHIHTTDSLSKYISRLQLVLSKTVTVNLDWSVVNIEEVDDVHCKDISGQELQGICTDGTGYISIDLAKKIDTNIFNGRRLRRRSSIEEEFASIFQVRLFQNGVARKGTLAANGELPLNTIRCYKSMVKVRRDDRVTENSLTSLELVSTSYRTPGRAKLSQDLIVLLSLCKVPESFFMKHLAAAMEKSYLIFSDPRAALEELLDWENDKADLLTDMISAKISLQEPFLHKGLLDMSKSKLQDFTKGKFPLDGAHYLLATADPTGTLKPNQVTITLSEGPIYCSKVLVYRAPGKHPGDIHVLKATCNERLEAAIDSCKYAIYFSTQGSRPITEEIGKGDLDGDRYWVCKNPELISHFQEWHCRWERIPTKHAAQEDRRKPTEFSPEELERVLFDRFLQARYNMKSVIGETANRWSRHMDEYLHIKDGHSEMKRAHLEEALKLPSPYYDSLDYAKTGIKPTVPPKRLHARRPHHMERQVEGVGVNAGVYRSKSILGKIYDKAVERKWCLPSYDNFEVDVGFQIPNHELHLKLWEENFTSYRGEMRRAMNAKRTGRLASTDPEAICLHYQKILYGGYSSFKEAEVLGNKERQLILEEASAVYTVVYKAGKDSISRNREPRLSFAWNVAGEALCEIYSKRQPGRSLHLSFGYFKEIFDRNNSRHQVPLSPELFSE